MVKEYRGTLNITDILNKFKTLQTEMGKIRWKDTGTQKFQKDLDKLVLDLQALKGQAEAGFFKESDITSFANKLQKLTGNINSIISRAQDIGVEFSKIQLPDELQKDYQNLDDQLKSISNKISSITEKITEDLRGQFTSSTGLKLVSETNLKEIADSVGDLQKIKQIGKEITNNANDQIGKLERQAQEQENIANNAERAKEAYEAQKAALESKKTTAEGRVEELTRRIEDPKIAEKERKDLIRERGVEKGKVTRAKHALEDLEKVGPAGASSKAKKKIEEIQQKISLAKAELAQFLDLLKQLGAGEVAADIGTQNLSGLINDLNKAEQEYKAVNIEKEKFEDSAIPKEVIEGINQAKNGLNGASKSAKEASENLKDVSESIKETNKVGQELDNLKNRIQYVFELTNVFGLMRQAVNKSYTAIKELDAAFTEIAVVTNKTNAQLWESFGNYNDMAQKLGVTTTQAIQTSALYYQQGLDTAEVMKLTEETIKMARIAGMDFAEATDRMTAALRGFKMEMEEAGRVNDIFSALAAESAVDTDELSLALTKTASIAASAGMEIETTSALLAQMIETTREAPENLGTAMKTVIARFQELKTAVNDSVEIEGEIVDVNRVDTALKSVGVQLRDSLTGQFRDLDEVFLELSSKWNTLDRNTQRYIATIAAGSRQQSRFIAMMDNYERTMELVDIAQSSSGESAIQFGKTLDSIEAKTNKLKSSFESLIGSTGIQELAKVVLDIANVVLQMLGDFADKGPTTLIIMSVLIFNMLKQASKQLTNGIQMAAQGVNSLGSKIKNMFAKESKNGAQELIEAIQKSNLDDTIKAEIIKGFQEGGLEGAQKVAQQRNVDLNNVKGYSGAASKINNSQKWSNIASAGSSIASAISSGMTVAALSSTEAEGTGATVGNSIGSVGGQLIGSIWGPIGSMIGQAVGSLVGTGIGWAVGAAQDAAKGIGSEKNIKRLTEEYQKIAAKAGETIEENDAVISAGERYLELAENKNRTNDETREMLQLQEEISSKYPELLGNLGEEAAGYKAVNDQLRERLELERQESLVAEGTTLASQQVKEYAELYSEIGEKAKEFQEENNVIVSYGGKDFRDLEPEEIEKAIADMKITTEAGSFDMSDQIKGMQDWLDYYEKNFQPKIKQLEESFLPIFSNLVSNVLSDQQGSFALDNIELISGYIKQDFDYKELRAIYLSELPEEEKQKYLEDLFVKKTAEAEQYALFLNNLNEDQREIFTRATNLIGLFGTGEEGFKQIDSYLKNKGIDETDPFYNYIKQAYEDNVENMAKVYGNLTEEIQEVINNSFKGNETELAAVYAELARKLYDSGIELDGLDNLIKGLYKTYEDNAEQWSDMIAAINKTDFTSSYSVEGLRQKLEKIGIAEKDIESITNQMGATFIGAITEPSAAFDSLNAQIEKTTNLIDLLGKAIEGALSPEEFNKTLTKLVEEFDMTSKDLQKITSSIFVTTDGIGINNGGGMKELIENEIDKLNAAAQDSLNTAAAYRELGDEENAANAQQNYIENLTNAHYLTMLLKKADLELLENDLDRVQAYKELVAEIEQYYNIGRKLLDLQNDYSRFELEAELLTDANQLAENYSNSLANLNEQEVILGKLSEAYRKDLKTYSDYINNDEFLSKYLSVDEKGILSQNIEARTALIEEFKTADSARAEQIQAEIDLIDETIERYEEFYDTAIEGAEQYLEKQKEVLEFENKLRENIITLQEKLQNLVVKNIQDEVNETKEKYNKIKAEDQKYLTSLQNNINKRKKILSEQDSEEEINELQNRIALLSRDTSGIYDKEIAQLQEELDNKLRQKEQENLDKLLEQEQEKTQKVAEELDLRANYLDSALKEELKTYKLTNKKVNELMQKSYEEILDYYKTYDEEFQKGTKEQQYGWTQDFIKMINDAKASEIALLTFTDEDKKKLNEKWEGIDSKLDNYMDLIDEANKKELELKVDISQLESAKSYLAELYEELDEVQEKIAFFDIKKSIKQNLEELKNSAKSGTNIKNQDVVNIKDETAKLLNNYISMGGSLKDFSELPPLSHKQSVSDALTSYYSQNYSPIDTSSSANEKTGFAVTSSLKFYAYPDNGNSEKPGPKPLNGKKIGDPGAAYLGYFDYNGESSKRLKILDQNNNYYLVKLSEQDYSSQDGSFTDKGGNFWIHKKWLGTVQYKTGGLVDYTGPAWVDGTKSKPEAFLSASDTDNIAKLRDILSTVFDSNKVTGSSKNVSNENSGDITYEIHINVDHLDDGYDADKMMKDIEKHITSKAGFRKVTKVSRR